MPKHDINALKQSITLPDLLARYGVELQKDGAGYKGLCPVHNENTPSFTVYIGKSGDWECYCFGCGFGTDHIDVIKEIDCCTTGEAINRLAEIVGGVQPDSRPQPRGRKEKPVDEWQRMPAPRGDEPPPPNLRTMRSGNWETFNVIAAWPYHNANGELIGYACRIEPEPGKKDVIPVCWMVNTKTGETRWKQKSLEKPRLLYGTEMLASNPEAQVLLVEGEKACDAASRLMSGTGIIVLTWPGGGKAVSHADWQLLAGRKVLGWPDCDSKKNTRTGSYLSYQDQPGMAAMLKIGEMLPADTEYRIVAVPYPGKIADGWDIADAEAEGGTLQTLVDIIKRKAVTPGEILAMPGWEADQTGGEPYSSEEHMESEQENNLPTVPDEYNPGDGKEGGSGEPFRILGYNRSTCYYMPDGFRQVVPIRTVDHGKLRLMELAPLGWWQKMYPTDKRSGDAIDWTLAAESMIRRAQRAGIWDDDLIRGRGAWWDQGRATVHLGDRVVADGEEFELGEAPGRFVYELNNRINLASGDPLPNGDACKLVDICEGLRWQRPISGKLLAGWVFLAPISGALDWRPHIWITGGAGSGKSTIMKHIVHRLLQDNMLFVQGETTEAGIRQELGHDAIPVVFDEIESQSERATARVNSIMDLMTIASSETGAKLVKGGANNKAMSYLIRSMFCFSSITVNLKQHAAKTRVTVLDMQAKPPNESDDDITQYNDMLNNIFTTLTPEYTQRLQARAVELLPTIRHNAQVFAEAAALSVGSRRFGDQVGTLIAGAYALHSRNEITAASARQWIEAQDWDEHDDGGESKDERALLQFILGQLVSCDTKSGPKRRAIGELIDIAGGLQGSDTEEDIGEENARATLRRHGIIVEGGFLEPAKTILVANNHPLLERILARSSWSTGWGRTLARLPGAIKSDSSKKFAGAASRYVEIPIDS